jgi:hypothetical protein
LDIFHSNIQHLSVFQKKEWVDKGVRYMQPWLTVLKKQITNQITFFLNVSFFMKLVSSLIFKIIKKIKAKGFLFPKCSKIN